MAREVQPLIWYTKGEMRRLLTSERSAALANQGYDVLQIDMDTGKCRIAKAADGTMTGVGSFAPVPGIQKRTRQQRLDSLMLKLVDGMKQSGGIDTLQSGIAARVSNGDGTSRPPTQAEKDAAAKRLAEEKENIDRQVSDIVGEAWKQGRTEITGDVVRKVAAGLLTRAEKQHEEKLAKQVTRHED